MMIKVKIGHITMDGLPFIIFLQKFHFLNVFLRKNKSILVNNLLVCTHKFVAVVCVFFLIDVYNLILFFEKVKLRYNSLS